MANKPRAFQFEATMKTSGWDFNENDLSRVTKVVLKTDQALGEFTDQINPLSTVRVTIEFEPKDDYGQDEPEEG